jgi:hypothetical protein
MLIEKSTIGNFYTFAQLVCGSVGISYTGPKIIYVVVLTLQRTYMTASPKNFKSRPMMSMPP